MQSIINGHNLTLGTCYYPEHWSSSLWKEDLNRMLENGIEVIRIAEFAWNLIEPTEGNFTYAFFDSFLEIVQQTGMKVIFCTPTATPPAWLTHHYPDALNADIDGNLYYHGSRRHYNYNSSNYQKLCRRIVTKSASHYGKHPAIIGWQIDNELNCETDLFYSESDNLAFREFLQKKYITLEALNKAWGTIFWNQTYTDWEEVFLPRKTVTGAVNPHLVLDYSRFISDSACRFAKMQADIIRQYKKPDDFITTNGIFSHLDYQRLYKESLDIITYDSYPNFAYCISSYQKQDSFKDRWWSKNLSQVRAISENFGIMEQQSGANGWNISMAAPTPRPGQMELWTMQSIAHGADFVSYFRWRTCPFGTEMYWHGILDYSGRNNRRLEELHGIFEKLKMLQSLAGSHYQAQVAVLCDYDNIWDARIDKWHQGVEQVSQDGIFQAAQLTHTPLNYIYLESLTDASSLSHYKVIFYPHASILTSKGIALLTEYVKQGGTLVMGCRTGYKDISGKCIMDYLPGLASELMGTDIPEYTLVAPDTAPVMAAWGDDNIEAAVFNDILCPVGQDAETIATYINSDYCGKPALIHHTYGKGHTYYFGGAFCMETAKVFLKKLGAISPYQHLLTIPECCELAVRKKEQESYFFLLNYSNQPISVTLHIPFWCPYTKEKKQGNLELNAYDWEVLMIKTAKKQTAAAE